MSYVFDVTKFDVIYGDFTNIFQTNSGSDIPKRLDKWAQTVQESHHHVDKSPFIRPKLTRLYEATCVSFERVLVENKLHGLSPSLSDAISSVSRWQLVQASVPHLFHCCATLLNNRAKLGHADKLGVAETKILHTLHWALLDAPEECMQNEEEKKGVCQLHVDHEGEFIYPLTTIQLFVYLFAPLVYCLRESDLSFSREWEGDRPVGRDIGGRLHHQRPPVTPSDTPSVSLEIVCEVCNTTVGKSRACNCGDLKVTAGDLYAKPRKVSLPKVPEQSITEGKLIDIEDEPTILGSDAPRPASLPIQPSESAPQEPSTSTKSAQMPAAATLSDPEIRRPAARLHDTCAASHFDVAVMRCLFNPSWSEEGILWALNYILCRLRQIADENTAADRVRQRSNSSPIPQITVCLFSPAPGMPHKKFSEPADLLKKSTDEIRKQKELEKEREENAMKKIKLEPLKLLNLRNPSAKRKGCLGLREEGQSGEDEIQQESEKARSK
ncbi:hypothetical protein BSL78_16605 [Apostichopus japonicus]|uniref:Cation channel complex component UNC80 N-terminal domain-containing protein n=1 Tax=Stichopus japonicus TaxID=307972 RepID=A0A2G8KEX4_STIJA|nr:hypothetical protein BSL78_16605 [Apostichopus japonicus]